LQLGAEVVYTDVKSCIWPTALGVVDLCY
jgi:hypothetical protein